MTPGERRDLIFIAGIVGFAAACALAAYFLMR